MFFTKVGRVVAWLLFVFAVFRLGLALAIATFAEDYMAMGNRYLGKSTGEAIDGTLSILAFALCLGILTEISRAVERQSIPKVGNGS